MNAYRNMYGLPSCTSTAGCFLKLNQFGSASPVATPEPSHHGWAEETSLDLDMVSASCPLCNIMLIEANSPQNADLYQAEQTAASFSPAAVSNSWGSSEYSSETESDSMFASGNTAFVFSAGDGGYSAGPQYPATSPYVISVGGTILQSAPNTTRGWTETVWKDSPGRHGTGSGCSAVEPRPSWQSTLAPSCPNARVDNDVSAVSQGVATYDSARSAFQKLLHPGNWEELAGTSVSAPLVAGLIGLSGALVTNAGTLYSAPSTSYFDVTSGANGRCGKSTTATYILCHAAAGWDGPTGLGTPVGTAPFQPQGDCDNDGDPGDLGEASEC
jgi:hypothetical protein